MNRSYALLTIKAVDDERRTIQGIATSARVDSYGDIVEPMGVRSKGDIPLFLYHDSQQTVGRAKLGKPTKDGVPFEATLPNIREAGKLKDRVDEAWHMIKYRLLEAVSIGFVHVEGAVESLKNGGLRFLEADVKELSLVPIGANSDALITAIKSIDTKLRAASGLVQSRSRRVARSAPRPGTGAGRPPGFFILPE